MDNDEKGLTACKSLVIFLMYIKDAISVFGNVYGKDPQSGLSYIVFETNDENDKKLEKFRDNLFKEKTNDTK